MGIPIARILGIEIRVQLGWVFLLALVAVIAVGELTALEPALEGAAAWLLGAVVALGFFVSTVSHDLAHALVARRRGVDVRSIGVSFFGGATALDPSSPNPGDDAAIAASGPLVSIGISGVLFGLMVGVLSVGEQYTTAAGVLAVLVFINLVLGVVNLVPAYPLDGGRIVRDLAWRRSGSERSGWDAASRTGRATGFVVIGAGVTFLLTQHDSTGVLITIGGWFFILSANTLRDRIRLDDALGGHEVHEAMDRDPVSIAPGLTVDTFAAQLLDRETSISAVPVVAGGAIVGLLGVSQVRRLRRADWPTTRVEAVMARPPKLVFLAPGEPLRAALDRVYRAGLDGLPVMDDGRLVGLLTKRGVARFIAAKSEATEKAAPPAS